jgi:hypothetical protein
MSSAFPIVPRDLVDPGPPPVPTKTLTRWASLLGAIASGVPLQDAMLKFFMTRADIEACVRLDATERQKWDDARLAARKKTWSVMEIEDVLAEIASGKSVKDAVAVVKGPQTEHARTFGTLIVQDPEFADRYLLALKSRAIHVSDEILELADDSSNDVIEGPKGAMPNNAAVNRSKLQVDARRVMAGLWYPKILGEKRGPDVQVNVQVNHAQRLEDARTRAAARRPTPPVKASVTQDMMQDAIDAVVVENDTSWLDQ